MIEFHVQVLGTAFDELVAAHDENEAVELVLDRWRKQTGAPPHVRPPVSVERAARGARR